MTQVPRPKSGLTKDVWRKAFAILDAEDRRGTLTALCVVILAALSSALMVASILPFLTLLANPDVVTENAALAWLSDRLGAPSPYGLLIWVGVGSILLIVLGSLVQVWKIYVIERYAARQALNISQRLFNIYLGKPYAFFLDRHSSDMATVVLSEVGEAVAYFLRPTMELIAAILALVAVTGLLLWVAPSLTFGVLVIVGGAFLVTSLATRGYAVRFGQTRAKSNAQRYQVVNEGLGGIKEIKVLGLEERYSARYGPPTRGMTGAVVGMRFISQMPRNVIHALVSAGVILICLFLVPAESYGSPDGLAGLIPTLGLFAMAAQRMIPELQKAYSAISQMQFGIAAIDRLFADFENSEVPDFKPAPPRLPFEHSFELAGVTYTYPSATRAGLRDISLTISAGETIGIVGSTGAGKTTLADVILGLLAPEAGALSVDGTRLDQDGLHRWRQTVGYVPQDIFLTDATLAENIAFGLGRGDIDPAQLERAARIANLHDFITADLPSGYDTMLGENGVRLSGGQRQRVGIARAVYRNADLIVFDEATSALDTLTEKEIMSSLFALSETKTLVLIAHRLSTIRACDRIIMLEDGMISDIGHWEELLQRNEAFQAFVSASHLNDHGNASTV